MPHIQRGSKDKVEVVYTNVGAGCMLTGIGLMTFASLFIFFIVPEAGFVKGFFGVTIAVLGLLVFGSMLIRMCPCYFPAELSLLYRVAT